jgi:hypothetical protein
MDRRVRMDVPECEHQVIFVDDLRWNLTVDNLFKKRFAHTP